MVVIESGIEIIRRGEVYKMIEIATLDDHQLKNLIKNYEDKGETKADLYTLAVSELDRRVSKGLNIQKTVDFLKTAAGENRFVTYGDVAKANDIDWSKVRRPMSKHLGNVLSYCHGNRMPYLTTIVVSQPNSESGKFDESNLKGLIDGLSRLGVSIPWHKAQQFVEDEQQKVFDWAKRKQV